MSKFRVSVCAGQGFKIRPIMRPYYGQDRVWPHEPGVTVFRINGEGTPSMYPYKKYVPDQELGGEG